MSPVKTISFVVPSWHYWNDPFKLQPLWELYYATVLRKHFLNKGVSVDITDLRGRRSQSFREVVGKIPQRDMYIYWIMKSGDSVEIQSTVKLLKAQYPQSLHVAGGTHVDMCTDECMTQFDAVIVGPGERSLVKIVNDSSSRNLQKIYQDSYKDVPFSDTPFPERDFLPAEAIVNRELFKQYGGVRGTSLYFSRGCIYHCSFCVYNVPNALQIRSPEMMKSEIKYLKENYRIEGINLRDEVAIHPDPRISEQMFEVLGGENIIWRGQTTTMASLQQLKRARETGCQELAVGVETVDDQVMKIINKTWQTQRQIREFTKNAKALGIKVKMCFIFGLPGEPRDIVDKTIKFIEEAQPDYVGLSGFCPLPGSPIFKNPEHYGIKFIDHDWSKHAHLLYRFSDEEEVGLPFEYERQTQWGKAFTREEIRENIRQTQRWLESRGRIY